jgi:hypothetical protein
MEPRGNRLASIQDSRSWFELHEKRGAARLTKFDALRRWKTGVKNGIRSHPESGDGAVFEIGLRPFVVVMDFQDGSWTLADSSLLAEQMVEPRGNAA